MLVQLQRDHVATMNDWLVAMPDPRGPDVELDDRQREKLRAAIQAEAAYRTRLAQVGAKADAWSDA